MEEQFMRSIYYVVTIEKILWKSYSVVTTERFSEHKKIF